MTIKIAFAVDGIDTQVSGEDGAAVAAAAQTAVGVIRHLLSSGVITATASAALVHQNQTAPVAEAAVPVAEAAVPVAEAAVPKPRGRGKKADAAAEAAPAPAPNAIQGVQAWTPPGAGVPAGVPAPQPFPPVTQPVSAVPVGAVPVVDQNGQFPGFTGAAVAPSAAPFSVPAPAPIPGDFPFPGPGAAIPVVPAQAEAGALNAAISALESKHPAHVPYIHAEFAKIISAHTGKDVNEILGNVDRARNALAHLAPETVVRIHADVVNTLGQ